MQAPSAAADESVVARQVSSGEPDPRTSGDETQSAAQPQLLVLSGKCAAALRTQAGNLGRRLAEEPLLPLADAAFTLGVGRNHHQHRAALIAADHESATQALLAFEGSADNDSLFAGQARRAPRVAWQFTGQGSQYVGMARKLYESYDAFRNAIDHCDQLIQDWRNQSLIEVMFRREADLNHTSWTQPAIFAVQMALTQLLNSWGQRPDAVMGHSVGQYAAACTAGMMSWDDGLYLISRRGQMIGELPPGGGMLAAFCSAEKIESIIDSVSEVSLAALNGTHVVVSGPTRAIEDVQQHCALSGIQTKPLTTSHAFHSSLMDPVLERFGELADGVAYRTGEIPLICNVSGQALPADCQLDGAYWANHIRSPVRYAECIQAVQQLDCEIAVELGPQAVLTRMAASDWRKSPQGLISLIDKGADDIQSLLKALGQLFVHGVPLDFESYYADARRKLVVLPTYPFQRRRFWGPDKPRAAHAEYHTAHPLLGGKISLAGAAKESRFQASIDKDSPSWLADHQVMGNVVLPGAAYVELAAAAARSGELHDLVFHQPLIPAGRTLIQSHVRAGEGQEQILETFSADAEASQWQRHFTAKIVPRGEARPDPVDRKNFDSKQLQTANTDEFSEFIAKWGPRRRK